MHMLRCSHRTNLNKTAFFIAVFFLCMVLFPSHMGMPDSERIHSGAVASSANQFYKFIFPITTYEIQSGSTMISIQVKNNFQQYSNKWLNTLLCTSILLYCCYMVIWFIRNDRPVPTGYANSSELSLRIGGHAPPVYILYLN